MYADLDMIRIRSQQDAAGGCSLRRDDSVWPVLAVIDGSSDRSLGIMQDLLPGRVLPGYASAMAVILFLTGVHLIDIGAIGACGGRILVESKGRPLHRVGARQIREPEGAGDSDNRPT
jgi:hypothetical protein